MKSNKSNKSIGKLAGQEVNTDQVKGGLGILQERVKSVETKKTTSMPGQTSDFSHNEQLKK